MAQPRLHETSTERVRAWKARNPERAAEHNRRSVANWRRRNPERVAQGRLAERLMPGFTSDHWQAMSEAQGGKCAICRREPTKKRLAIDHDHSTRRVRGLLCAKCNLVLGLMGDDAAVLRRAADYLDGGA